MASHLFGGDLDWGAVDHEDTHLEFALLSEKCRTPYASGSGGTRGDAALSLARWMHWVHEPARHHAAARWIGAFAAPE